MLRFPFLLLLVVVSRFFSAVLRFLFLRSGLVQTTVIFQKPFAIFRCNLHNLERNFVALSDISSKFLFVLSGVSLAINDIFTCIKLV